MVCVKPGDIHGTSLAGGGKANVLIADGGKAIESLVRFLVHDFHQRQSYVFMREVLVRS